MCFRRGLRRGQQGECSVYQAYKYSQKGRCTCYYEGKTIERIEMLHWRPLYRFHYTDGTTRTMIGYERIMCYRY